MRMRQRDQNLKGMMNTNALATVSCTAQIFTFNAGVVGPHKQKNDKQGQPAVRPASWHFKFNILWPENWLYTASKLAASKLAITNQQSWPIFCLKVADLICLQINFFTPDTTKNHSS